MGILSERLRDRISRNTILMAGILMLALASFTSCSDAYPDFNKTWYSPEYASGFSIVGNEGSASRVIRITQAWQGADSTAMELFIARNGEKAPAGFHGQTIREKAVRIAAMSSTHVAMLDMLDKASCIKAVSGIGYITNAYVRSHQDEIRDIGYDSNIDMEALVNCRPDLVLLYGISSSSSLEKRLEGLGIPYLYIGEYLETSPLGRLEWIVAMAEITGCTDKGTVIFRKKEKKYLELAAKVSDELDKGCIERGRPQVMLNTPYGDTWFMASETSAMANLLRDAGAEYIYKGNRSNKSEPIGLEKAYLLASEADFWLNTGQLASLDELKKACPKFAGTSCVKDGRVYNCDKRANGSGGNDFWESGPFCPELILEDLIRIFHPGLLPEGETVYYRRLE